MQNFFCFVFFDFCLFFLILNENSTVGGTSEQERSHCIFVVRCSELLNFRYQVSFGNSLIQKYLIYVGRLWKFKPETENPLMILFFSRCPTSFHTFFRCSALQSAPFRRQSEKNPKYCNFRRCALGLSCRESR